MKVYYCNGKKGICQHSNGEVTIDCCACEFIDGSGGAYVECDDVNPYWERICKLSLRQRKKGLKTYGQGLEHNPAAITSRIEHLQEELVDALMYCEWIKDKIKEGDPIDTV